MGSPEVVDTDENKTPLFLIMSMDCDAGGRYLLKCAGEESNKGNPKHTLYTNTQFN